MSNPTRNAAPQGHRVKKVEPGSIAWQLGLRPDDRVLAIDDRPIVDIFDYHLWQLQPSLVLSVLQASGERIDFEIEKDEDDLLGLTFAEDLLDESRGCCNHCLFCFIDQLPEGLRSSLYFKDDDLRLSFLHGNYVTLTNLSDSELARLIGHRLSPINVSVHATDPSLRQKMMGQPRAGKLMTQLRRIAAARLSINAQIVLCPGLNDGKALEQTFDDLLGLGEPLQSVAVVPVGLTSCRDENDCPDLAPVSPAKAREVIGQIESRQETLLASRGSRVLFAADEFYLKAGLPLPPLTAYEDFLQLENGVGMIRQTLETLQGQIESILKRPQPPAIGPRLLVTGTAFEPLLARAVKPLQGKLSASIQTVAVPNRLFGESITVAGLLCGADIVRAVKPHLPASFANEGGRILLPDNLLKSDAPLLLDDMSLATLSQELEATIEICRADGSDFAATLLGTDHCKGDLTHE